MSQNKFAKSYFCKVKILIKNYLLVFCRFLLVIIFAFSKLVEPTVKKRFPADIIFLKNHAESLIDKKTAIFFAYTKGKGTKRRPEK